MTFRVWLGLRVKCGRSVAEVWLGVTDVTDGYEMANYILARIIHSLWKSDVPETHFDLKLMR